MEHNELQKKYKEHFQNSSGVPDQDIEELEQYLGSNLPEDFKKITKWYSGGLIGNYSIFNINTDPDDEYSLLYNTLFFRKELKLPNSFIVLYYEYGAILLCLDNIFYEKGTILHVDNMDLVLLCNKDYLLKPLKTWKNFTAFFEEQISSIT